MNDKEWNEIVSMLQQESRSACQKQCREQIMREGELPEKRHAEEGEYGIAFSLQPLL